ATGRPAWWSLASCTRSRSPTESGRPRGLLSIAPRVRRRKVKQRRSDSSFVYGWFATHTQTYAWRAKQRGPVAASDCICQYAAIRAPPRLSWILVALLAGAVFVAILFALYDSLAS